MNDSKKTKFLSDHESKAKKSFLEKCLAVLEKEQPARTMEIVKDSPEELFYKELSLLTSKEVIYVANVDEDQAQTIFGKGVKVLSPLI